MRDNSGAGAATNNNRDPTLKEHGGKKGPAQTVLHDNEFDEQPKAPSDSRESRK